MLALGTRICVFLFAGVLAGEVGLAGVFKGAFHLFGEILRKRGEDKPVKLLHARNINTLKFQRPSQGPLAVYGAGAVHQNDPSWALHFSC